LETHPEPPPGSHLSLWDLAALAGLAGLAILAAALWPRLPDPLPTHWGFDHRPNGWTPKAVVPWLMFGLPAGIWGLLFVVGHFAVPREPVLAEVQRRAMAPLRGMLILAMCVLLSLTVLLPLFGPGVFKPILLAFLGLLALGIALMATAYKRGMPAEYTAHYKWGLFYANPDDDRLMVPKLMGIGWTFNFARPAAWWLMGLLLLMPLAAILLPLLAGR
jgi:uncharacterized membrane protein